MTYFLRRLGAATALALLALPFGAAGQVLPNAVEGAPLNVTTAIGSSTPMAVAYVPAFDRYYAGSGGFTNSPMTVFSAAGAQLQQGVTGVDERGVYFNANTGTVESVSFSASATANAVSGIQTINLDGTGNLLGTNTQVLAGPIPALGDSQTMPSFSAGTNLLYAKQGGTGNVNVVNRATGAAAGTIALDLATAGVTPTDINTNFVGFTGLAGTELAIYDVTNHRVLVFSLAGNFVGASLLPAIATTFDNQTFGTGFANGFFFVWDAASGTLGGWRRFQVTGVAPPPPASVVPTLAPTGIAALAALLLLAAGVVLRRRRTA